MAAALTTSTLFAQVPSYVPTNGLVGYWPFNGNANDESGNTNNGTVNGSTLTTDRFGNSNSAYDFNGLNNLIRIPHQNSLNLIGDYSISVWYKGNYQNIFNNGWDFIAKRDDNGNCCSPNVPYQVYIPFNGTNYAVPVMVYANGNYTFSSPPNTSPISLDQWQNLIITNTSDLLKFYINGELIFSENISSTLRAPNTADLLIGSVNRELGAEWMNGKLDDIGIWNRALTQQEITNIYNSSLPQTACLPANVPTTGLVGYWPFCGNANDESGNGNNGTNNGATLTTDRFGNSNSAYVFNGIDNFISFPQKFNFHNAGDASISIWIKSNSIPNAFQATFLKSRISSTDNNRFNFFLNPISGNLLTLNFDYRESNFNIHILNINNIQLNTWQNIIYTRTGNTYSLYINGTFINSSVDNLPNLPTEIGWVIGNDPSSNSDFSGLIDDIGIWNRALNQEDITNLYNANQCFNLITVTDSLIINVGQLSYNNPVTYANNITIAPNPASSQININFNNITNLNGGTLKIINSLGQEVATTPITTSGTNSTMQLATWGGTGMYFVQIINPQGQIIDIKKIILQ